MPNNGKRKYLDRQLKKLKARRDAASRDPGFKLPGSMNRHKQS